MSTAGEHRIAMRRIPSPDGTCWWPLTVCTCGWSTVDACTITAVEKIGAHIRTEATRCPLPARR
jgi:hypothetical protein